ncbi:hypothetical protein CA850_05870 [Micromonospora echinospora]|uniref:Uncharacterized protein n=1 Tax=Micromonospora echinospora TaxID=1877 RepID=A0A1C4V2M4_MICEC|nr:hypothetical protein [Micromonospora echinospora]OZV83032.1 hypothetical protein CA850_05870 [Micromonospora echinospora]SCE78183.1 hypothetical protein GA0070618_0885 [Micromonospora echinospora]
MSNYPETFDPTGPASLADAYSYLNWTAVSAARILAEQPGTSWEQLPSLLGEKWGDLDWYQNNAWLADFYNAVYQYASSLPPVEIFAVDEMGEPATDMARLVDSVVQTWTTAAYQDEESDEQSYDEQDQWSSQDQWTGQDQWVEHDQWTGSDQWTGQEQWAEQGNGTGHEPAVGPHPTGAEYDPEAVTADEPDIAQQEPLSDIDPDVARQVLAKVLDDEADDLSEEDEKILATVLTVEKFQYLAREFELV